MSWKFPTTRSMYYVWRGEVRFKVYDTEFVAKDENVVDIPKFAEHEAEVLSDAIVYDVGGLPMWEAFLEDRKSILKHSPARWDDPTEVEALCQKYSVPIQTFGKA